MLQTLEGSDFVAQDVSEAPAELVAANTIVVVGGSWTEFRLAGNSAGDQIVLAAVDDGDAGALERALLCGADDAFYKPISPRSLMARLAVARHRLLATPRIRRTPRATLLEALRAGDTGSVVVRGAEVSGTIHVHEGGISWAESAGHEVSLPRLVARVGVAIDDDTARAVMAEARQTGVHFTRVLADWGILDARLARECVRAFVADEVDRLLSDPGATAFFLPYDSRRASELVFPVDEILTATPAESGVVPAQSSHAARPLQTIPGHIMLALHGAGELPGAAGRCSWIDPGVASPTPEPRSTRILPGLWYKR